MAPSPNSSGGYNSGASNTGRLLGIASGILSLLRPGAKLPGAVQGVSDIGIDFSVLGKKNRQGISRKETGEYGDEEQALYNSLIPAAALVDTTPTPYFNREYPERVKYLNLLSTHPEIEFILTQVADEAIVYDKFNYFCKISLADLTLDDNVRKSIQSNFRRIYTLLNFADGATAWAMFYKWLIEGFLAYEILYDDPNNPTRITGFLEMRPDTLVELVVQQDIKDDDGKVHKRNVKVWKQYSQTVVNGHRGVVEERTMSANSVIFISYNRTPGGRGRLAYCERLVRSFNLMRTMENTKVAWHIMHSQFRLKMIIPVGTKTTAKARQALNTVTNRYKEDLSIDHNSGEIDVNGSARLNFGRNIVLPSRNGQEPTVEGISYDGPNLSDMEGVKYFERKLWRDSRLPFSRFDRENGSGTRSLFGGDGVPHDELSYYKFLNRLRSEFSLIIRKPVYLQTLMDHPALKYDLEFQSKLGIDYDSNSLFEEAKEAEVQKSRLDQLSELERLTEIDGRTPIYSKEYLYVNRSQILTKEEWDVNRKMRDRELKESDDREKKAAADAEAEAVKAQAMQALQNTGGGDDEEDGDGGQSSGAGPSGDGFDV